MKKPLITTLCLFVAISLAACASFSESQERNYGSLKTAVTYSKTKIVGEFGDRIPGNLDEGKFFQVIHGKIPENFYNQLTEHFIVILPKKNYYLIKVYDKNTYAMIMFDYSCTTAPDGLVQEFPEKYNLEHLELYDPCK